MKKFVVLICVLMIATMPTCFAYMNGNDVNLINYMDENLISAGELEESVTEGNGIKGVMAYDIMCYDIDLDTDERLTAIEYYDSEGNFHTWFAAFETREELYQFIEETIDTPHGFHFFRFHCFLMGRNLLGRKTGTYAAYCSIAEQDETMHYYSNVDDFISFLRTCE